MPTHPFTADELAEMFWEEPDGWSAVPNTNRITDKSRWTTGRERVITNGSQFFLVEWREGNTEYQDSDNSVNVIEVYPHQVMTTVYKDTPQNG